ncbi:MAG: DUF1266 domain-containing protein [Desulfobacteraceae bacterium]
MEDKTREEKALYPSQRWALTLSELIYGQYTNFHNNALYHRSDENLEQGKKRLERFWRINSKETFFTRLKNLEAGNNYSNDYMKNLRFFRRLNQKQRKRYLEGLKDNSQQRDHYKDMIFVKQAMYRFDPTGIMAYEYGCYVMLCRNGALFSYISDDEAWSLIMPIARKTQQCFTDWHDYWLNYLAGRHARFEHMSADAVRSNVKDLIKFTGVENGPADLPWDTDLSQPY